MTELPQESFFSGLLRISQEQKLQFLVVGGNAINSYGYQRTTFDIDIAVPEEQSGAWKQQFQSMGYEIYFATNAFYRFKAKNEEKKLLFPVDLMILSSDTFENLRAGGAPRPMGNVSVPVPSPLHLVAMKLHALRQPLRAKQGKDLTDIMGLICAAEIDVRSDEFQSILLKHADSATREQLLRHLHPDS